MAGDWIKIENITPEKPEVYQIAEELGLDIDAVIGKLVRLWIWADEHTIDGEQECVTEALLDRYTCNAGFTQALLNAEWLEKVPQKVGKFRFKNFVVHNGKGAKKRLQTQLRVAKHRAFKAEEAKNKNGNAAPLQSALPEKEKEKDIYRGRKKFAPPTAQQVRQYAKESNLHIDAEKFVAFYGSKGWMVGKNKMTNWKLAVQNWCRNNTGLPPGATDGTEDAL